MRPMLQTPLILLASLALVACDDGGDSSGMMTPEPEAQPEAQPEPEPMPEAQPEPEPSASTFAVVVTGTLFTDDLAEAQSLHDQLAGGGEAAATAAGDFAHDAMLGTTLLGSPEDQFFAMDRWTSAENMGQFYSNPEFATAFGTLFDGAPSLSTWMHAPEWHGWGDLEAGDGADTSYFVVVRGTLADDAEAIKGAHDQIAAGGEAPAKAAGDVAHVVYLGLEEPRAFLAIDVWRDSTNIEGFYGDPDFQAAFGTLFAAPPTVTVYRSTDWYQW